MASSKSSPGPHDRRVDPATGTLPPKPRCIRITKTTGKRCRRDAIGRTKLCKSHKALAEAEAATKAAEAANGESDGFEDGEEQGTGPANPANPTPEGIARGGAMTKTKKEAARNLGKFVINEQARTALTKLGRHDAATATDPRQTLLDMVASAWRQQQVWEQMLAAVPDDDWQFVGVTPVPGSQLSAKGARIEAIQKYLGDATKAAARISKLAIDAGIEERLVRLAEEQSAMLADTVKAGILAAMAILIRELRIKPAVAERVLAEALGSAAHHLQLLAAGAEQDPEDPAAEPVPSYAVVDGHFTKVDTEKGA